MSQLIIVDHKRVLQITGAHRVKIVSSETGEGALRTADGVHIANLFLVAGRGSWVYVGQARKLIAVQGALVSPEYVIP